VIYVFGAIAALFLGLGFVLQQHAAREAPPSDLLRFRLLLDLLHKPVWIGGIASMVTGQILSAVALANADVSLVEPMLASNLLFALAFARLLYHQRLVLQEWAGALMLSLGVTAFIVAGQPTGGNPDGDSLARWALAIGLLLLAEVCVVAGRKLDGPPRAMLLATAAGLLFGLQDGLTRRASKAFHHGIAGGLVHWAPYALVAIGIVGVLLAQSAFEVGSLQASLPAITASEPLAGIAVGIFVFGEHVHLDWGALTVETGGLAAMVGGVLLLGNSRTFQTLEVQRQEAKARAEEEAAADARRD